MSGEGCLEMTFSVRAIKGAVGNSFRIGFSSILQSTIQILTLNIALIYVFSLYIQ